MLDLLEILDHVTVTLDTGSVYSGVLVDEYINPGCHVIVLDSDVEIHINRAKIVSVVVL